MKKVWPKLLLAISSALLTLVAMELAYRAKLYFTIGHIPLGMSATYVVTNNRISVPHEQLGYELLAHEHTVSVRITEGRPVLCYERFTNEFGNYGPAKDHYANADLKIAVFGDSCTAVGGRDVWPTRLEQRLSDQPGCRVCVLNFARDGYGILQMFDLAALKVPQFEPDVVLISFISDDLTRARLVAKPVRRADVQTSFQDSRLTGDWCERMLNDPDPDDPLLAQWNDDFQRSKQLARPINYFTWQSSLLYNRLVWEDPFFHRPDKSQNPRITIDDYSQDALFVGAATRLKELGVPCYLIHLPEYQELRTGANRLRPQEKKLLASLQRVTGLEVIDLVGDAGQIHDVESLFNHPHDLHPSSKGLAYYAAGVQKALSDELQRWCPPSRRTRDSELHDE